MSPLLACIGPAEGPENHWNHIPLTTFPGLVCMGRLPAKDKILACSKVRSNQRKYDEGKIIMSNVIPLLNTLPTSIAPADVEFFDPPMCCPTGLCGPTLDETLLDVNEMILSLQKENLRVERYQMAGTPNAFLNNPEVMRLVREKQMEALPITVVRGRVVKVGAYPTLAEMRILLNGAVK
jgi:hypothetical protein